MGVKWSFDNFTSMVNFTIMHEKKSTLIYNTNARL